YRQTFAQKMEFNDDGTIKPITLTSQGVGALRQVHARRPNLALAGTATASSIRPDWKIKSDASLNRTETFAPVFATDDSNGSRWMAAVGDATPWWQIDLGAARDIAGTEAYFVKPAAGHAYKIEASLDGKTWTPYGGHTDVVRRSPHMDQKPARVRYLRLTILAGEPGLWEFRAY
ncbi:MAG: discoidin domain-containing protein, partial [Verrucomicrobia bacterium]